MGSRARRDVPVTSASSRTRGDLCPGVLRPWPADDGMLVRLRLVGGHLTGHQLAALIDVAERFGDGAVHLTARANLQLRGVGKTCPLPESVIAAIESTGLLPSRSHELVRNIMVSPQTGYAGGRADVRPVADELDALLRATPPLGDLPGRFLFVIDDGRGDLQARPCDLGAVALSAECGQLRVGDAWGPVVDLRSLASAIAALAGDFLRVRGMGPSAPWHVRELDQPLAPVAEPHPDLPGATGPLEYGRVPGGIHHSVADGVLTRASAGGLFDQPVLVVTPWRGVLVPEPAEQT